MSVRKDGIDINGDGSDGVCYDYDDDDHDGDDYDGDNYDGDDYDGVDYDGDGTDRLKAVLCAVRQWLRFQLHREAGAAKKKTFKAKLNFEKLDLELQKHILSRIIGYLGGWASNSGILISIYPPPQHPPPLFLSYAPFFSYFSPLSSVSFFLPSPSLSPASSPPLRLYLRRPA